MPSGKVGTMTKRTGKQTESLPPYKRGRKAFPYLNFFHRERNARARFHLCAEVKGRRVFKVVCVPEPSRVVAFIRAECFFNRYAEILFPFKRSALKVKEVSFGSFAVRYPHGISP